MNRTKPLLSLLKRLVDCMAHARIRGRINWPTTSGSKTSSDSFEIKGSKDGGGPEELASRKAQSKGVAKIPSTFEEVVEKRAAELSPPQ